MRTVILLILGVSYLLHGIPESWIASSLRRPFRRLAAAGFLLGALGHFGEAFVQVKENITNAKHETVQVASRPKGVTNYKRNAFQKRSASGPQLHDVESAIAQPEATVTAR